MKDNEVLEWFWIAEEDVRSAKLLEKDSNPPNSIIYYHCSQAIEKYLKGFLVYNNKEYNRDHNLSTTIKKCIDCDNSFNEIMPECNKMSMSIKNLRYPRRIIPTKEDIKNAFNLIDKVTNLKPIHDLFNKLNNGSGNNLQSIP